MKNFNKVWEKEIYGVGKHLNRYPFDNIVSFVFKNYPRDKQRKDIRILEVGCGVGNNLWFAAREGFTVTGIDGSQSAIDWANNRFAEEGLKGEFILGDFTTLPFGNNKFDIVFDRGSLVCVDRIACAQAIREIYRVTQPGGVFFLNLYSDRDTSFHEGIYRGDGVVSDIRGGLLTGMDRLCFYGRNDIQEVVGQEWLMKSIAHTSWDDVSSETAVIRAEWEIVLQKPSPL